MENEEAEKYLQEEREQKETLSRELEYCQCDLAETRLRLMNELTVKEGLQKDYEQLYDSYNETDTQLK